LTSNDFLLNLDERAAGAAGREHDIGEEVTLDVVLLADFETLEELEAREISFCRMKHTWMTYTYPIPQKGKIMHYSG
jgi:hypothetical protein